MIKQVFKRILLSINLLLALALVGGVTAGFISPIDIPILIIPGLAFPYFFVANIAFGLFWVFVKHRFFYNIYRCSNISSTFDRSNV
ncbi:MAG: hypothetical protein PF517_01185 [Salinivirgaceae bacterium]|jgi:hypothetical protein|nr:hypothetical protein [Salinivirgaceae bacterium]